MVDGLFRVIDCADWADFKYRSSDCLKPPVSDEGVYGKFLFRGQSCSEWSLRSSFDRKCPNLTVDEITDRHAKMMIIFRKNLVLFGNQNLSMLNKRFGQLEDLSELDLQAIAQHFGLSTKLMDWSYSLYVAAYFAFSALNQCESGRVSVWALNKDFSTVLNNSKIKLIDQVYSENTRQLWQLGVFIDNLTSDRDLRALFLNNSQHYTGSILGKPPLLFRFDIPVSAAKEAVDDLNMMRISSLTLFPGIEGVVKWMNSQGYQ